MNSNNSDLSCHLIRIAVLLTSFFIGCVEPRVQQAGITLPPPESAQGLPPTEGNVLVRIEVAPDGRPRNVTVSKSSGYKSLDDAAVAAAKDWRLPSGHSRIYLWECRFQLKPEK